MYAYEDRGFLLGFLCGMLFAILVRVIQNWRRRPETDRQLGLSEEMFEMSRRSLELQEQAARDQRETLELVRRLAVQFGESLPSQRIRPADTPNVTERPS
jgi:hypothetical protein